MAHERRFNNMSLSPPHMPAPSAGLKHSRLLMISPNQDALLEFEERHRRETSICNSSARADDNELSDPLLTPKTPAGLPPPPRGPRGSKSLPSELTALYGIGEAPKQTPGSSSMTASSSVSNPFINPAPTMEELQQDESTSAHSFGIKGEPGQQGKGAAISAFPGQFTSEPDHSMPDSHAQNRGRRLSVLPSLPMFDFLHLSPPTDQKSPNDRHSFIDLFSPNSFNDADDLNTKSGSNSPKLFDRSLKSRRISLGVRGFSTPPPLPLTTNLLDTNERADLVRKSKKLAHVFGQTPEAGALLHGVDPTVVATSPRLSSPASRRHSLPFALGSTAIKSPDAAKMRSPVSFIDLSDDDDTLSAIIPSPRTGRRRCSVSSISPSEHPEVLAEEARRRKREKLAKLHRFLGSRVPASLAFGLDHSDSPLPPERMFPPSATDDPLYKVRGTRRSSCASESPPAWADDLDRIKAELGDREKAINVKRAQKMEKVFGVAPPQTLYHTRHVPSPSVPSVVDIGALHQRNPNRSAYTKNKAKKESRPGSSESSQGLLPKGSSDTARDSSAVWSALITKSGRRSEVYSHYQHSLNSLHDILDRDDKACLAELHQYLNGSDYSSTSPSSPVFQFSPTKDRRASNASSAKSDRRRSLPTRTSMVSIASEISSVTSPKPDITDFQLRRRRAAKLTSFFGVDYRVLVNNVLESIESGLEHERKRGTLQADEIEDLLQKLRELKRRDIC